MTWREPTNQTDADQKLIDGVQKLVMGFASSPVGGPSITLSEIVKVLQERIAIVKAMQAAKVAYRAAVKAVRDGRAESARMVKALRRLV